MYNMSRKIPALPKVLALPFKFISVGVHGGMLAAMLNKVLSSEIKRGELDFMQDRRVTVVVRDAGINFHLTMRENRICMSNDENHDLMITGSLYDFMALISQQEDPDTLVFQRRLVMEGDTELGLGLKNFLDAIDIQSSRVLKFTHSFSGKALPIYQRVFG